MANLNERDMIKGRDEQNAAVINLIISQEWLPDDVLRHERTSINPAGNPYTVVSVGVPGIGLTRGSDNDILVALINAFIDAGCPEDGVITTTAYGLLKLAGMRTSGQYYQSLSQGLERMLNTTFYITDGWFDSHKKRYTTVSFRLIDNLSRTHEAPSGEQIILDRRSIIKIRLNDEITRSIRAGYIKSFDLDFYGSLKTVGSRNLYRYLDARLDRDGQSRTRLRQWSIDMVLLGHDCGLVGKRTDHLRKSIEAMCAPLLAKSYLKKVEFVGRGAKTRVHFYYGSRESYQKVESDKPPVNPELVKLLEGYGVHPNRAKWFVAVLGEDVRIAVALLEEKLKKGEKFDNTGGYLARLLDQDLIRFEKEKAELQAQKEKERQTRETEKLRKHELYADSFQELAFPALMSSDLELAAEAALSDFNKQLLVRRGYTIAQLDDLRAMVTSGQCSAPSLASAVNQALMRGLEFGELIKLI
ncbi:replication initiator protein A [Deinococcus multiflagellatus]|uniref:Replication initiator protein A n=1 Tax=Deinococcus multiflagellatus TaxID=1656887 RepID=A0ABW1ZQ70_9DEIO|nr:replication initiator protein A [Deinococcus multiflagellatus]MBZ9714956.1 replication initiator protein A [Deinococcus multiflagellatus]